MNQKLDVGNVLTRTFETYRDQFTLLIPAALALFFVVALLNGLVLSGGGVLATILVLLIGTVATYWFQGMVVEAVRDILDGRRDHTVGSLFQSAVPVIVPLFLVGLLAGIAIAIGFVLLIVPGLFLLTIWAVVAPVIVIERVGALESFGRSRALVRGSGWQVFSVIVVLFLLQFILTLVIQSLANSVSDTVTGYAVADLIVRLLVAPLSALAASVIYFELKALRGEPILARGEGGELTPVEQPAGGPAPTPVEPPPPPPAPEAPRPPTTGTEGTGSGPTG